MMTGTFDYYKGRRLCPSMYIFTWQGCLVFILHGECGILCDVISHEQFYSKYIAT